MSALLFKNETLHIVSNHNTDVFTYGYQPVTKGEIIPAFHLHSSNGIAKSFASGSLAREVYISLQDFLDHQQPLVIAFLGAPGQAAVHVEKLEALQADVQNNGGKLLVLTPIEPKYLRRKLKQSNTLTIFHDNDNTIAELFGLYEAQNPLWQWVSGIEEEEQSLPALYVIAPDRSVAYSHVDYSFNLFAGTGKQMQRYRSDLLDAVAAVSQQYHYVPLKYRLVS